MGNTKSAVLKEQYEAREYRTIIQHTDHYIGPYQLIKFKTGSGILHLRSTLEPTKYDHYNCDYDLFSSKMSSVSRNICGFEFLNESAVQSQGYDLIFEFGNYINSQFYKEQTIWEFIDGMLEGLAFLQAEGLHYPILRKKYTTYVSDTRTFKLLNPFCFMEFVEKAIGVYFNCDVDLIEKADFSRQSINRNVKEFAIMVLALIKNVDESHFIRNPALIKPAIKSLRGVYSDELVNLLAYIIKSREVMNFIDLRNFVDLGGDRMMESLGSRDSLPNMIRKLQMNDTQSSLRTQHTHSETNLHREINSGNKQHMRHNYSRPSMTQLDDKIFTSNAMPTPGHQNVNKYLDNYNNGLEHGLGHNCAGNFKLKSHDSLGFQPDEQDNKARDHSSVIEEINVSQVTSPSPKVVELEFKDEHQFKTSKTDIQDLRGLHKTIQEISNTSNLNKHSGPDFADKRGEMTQEQEESSNGGLIETHNDPNSRASLTGQARARQSQESKEAEPARQSATQQPSTKKIKRFIMKWITSENKHKEFIEYEDGTLEEKPDSDANQVKTVINDFYQKNGMGKPPSDTKGDSKQEYKPKKSAMHFDVSTIEPGDVLPQIVSKNNFNIILFSPEPKDPPKIIFTSSIKDMFPCYDFMKGIVDQNSALKISKYHQDVEG